MMLLNCKDGYVYKMKIIYYNIKRLYRFFAKILRTIRWAIILKSENKNIKSGKTIVCEGYIVSKGRKIKHYNWGDDINVYMFEYISNITVLAVPIGNTFLKNIDHFLMIGSIISFYNLDNATIFGTGIIDEHQCLKGNPKCVISVRGPKTRQKLLVSGIDCPQQYGDPVLLLPLFYKPEHKKSKKICIIPNMGTSYEEVEKSIKWLDEEYIILDMTRYNKWTDIIDVIVSSEYVISESLHGLIVAETYGIPNVWVEFKEHQDYWSFKFQDFYESIGKRSEQIIHLPLESKSVYYKKMNWRKGNIKYDNILSLYPFEISAQINQDISC